MTDLISDRLRTTLRALLEEHRTDAASLSREIGRSKDYIRDFLEGRKTSLPMHALVKIEKAFALEPGFLIGELYIGTPPETLYKAADELVSREVELKIGPNWPQYEIRKDHLPVFAYQDAMDGTLFVSNHVHHTIPRPSIVENSSDAYAIIVEGDIMSPSFDPGDIAIVNPNISFRPNADAILYGHVGSEELPKDEFQRCAIRRLTGYDKDLWHVQELQPARTTTLERTRWPRVSRIVGKFSRP